MQQHKAARYQVGLRRWATCLGVTALLILLSGTSREANALTVFHVGGVDHALNATELPPSPFLPSFSMDVQGLPTSSGVDLRSRSPITPVSPAPSSGLLFLTALLGMVGVAVHGEPFVRTASRPLKSDRHRPSSTHSVVVHSQDGAFAEDIEERLRRAGYNARVATAVKELFAVPDPASLALVIVDHRTPDWDMLRTDPALRHVQLMAVVPLGTVYTDQHCIADLERGLDGVHDLRDGHRLLIARVGAYLRRTGAHLMPRGAYQLGAVEFDGDSHEVAIAGQPVHLSAKPFAILGALIREPEKVFTRSELTTLLWGPNFAVGEHTLDVHVHALRRQLDRDPDRRCRLVTVKGVGFKLKPVFPVTSVRSRRVMPPFHSLPRSQMGLRQRPRIGSGRMRSLSGPRIKPPAASGVTSACG